MTKLMRFGFFLASVHSYAYAADGYKDIKFGSALSLVRDKKICTLEPLTDRRNVNGDMQYFCKNFPFSGSSTVAVFYFIDDRFERLAISLNGNINGVYNALKGEYGEPSMQLSTSEGERKNSTGRTVTTGFDRNSVIMTQAENSVSELENNQLIYNSPFYQNNIQ